MGEQINENVYSLESSWIAVTQHKISKLANSIPRGSKTLSPHMLDKWQDIRKHFEKGMNELASLLVVVVLEPCVTIFLLIKSFIVVLDGLLQRHSGLDWRLLPLQWAPLSKRLTGISPAAARKQ